MITKWSLNVQRYNGKFTHWLASLCGGCRPERMKDGRYGLWSVGLLVHSLSTKSFVFCPAFLQLLRKMDMGYKSHHLFLIYLRYCSVLWFNKGILWVCNKIQISVLHLDSTRNQPYLSFLSFLNFGGMTPHFWRR